MILFIDNYDSFTYNLVQYFGEFYPDIQVYRNDKIQLSKAIELNPSMIIISPGPGNPQNTGVSLELIEHFYKKIPILGICLGHQAIGYFFGAKIVHAPTLMHGKTSLITHWNDAIFEGISSPFQATRYHSLIIKQETLPDNLKIIAKSEDEIIMGIKHKDHLLYGLQFHPESILTTHGKTIIRNFLKIGGLL